MGDRPQSDRRSVIIGAGFIGAVRIEALRRPGVPLGESRHDCGATPMKGVSGGERGCTERGGHGPGRTSAWAGAIRTIRSDREQDKELGPICQTN